jgi:hypothetical protein
MQPFLPSYLELFCNKDIVPCMNHTQNHNYKNTLHIASIACLALGMFCGNVSLSRILPNLLTGIPPEFLELRYLCIPASITAGLLAGLKPDYFLKKQQLMALVLCLFLYIFCTALASTHIDAGIIAPYILLPVYVLTLVFLIRSKNDLIMLIHTMLGLSTAVLVAFFYLKIAKMNHYILPMSYFYSRSLFVGYGLCMMHIALKPSYGFKNKKTIILFCLAAAFIAAGVMTEMRVASLFYCIPFLLVLPYLIAKKAYRLIAFAGGALLAGYALSFSVAGVRIIQKHTSYNPIHISNAKPIDADKALCLKQITNLGYAASVTSCDESIILHDKDTRLRLFMAATTGNTSPFFGNGFGSFTFVDGARTDAPIINYAYPHNFLAQVYYQSGLAGLALIGVAVLQILVLILRKPFNQNGAKEAFFIIPTFFFLSANMAGDFYDARYVFLIPILYITAEL